MYYKVMKDSNVIDVLDKIVYLKWQPKHNIMVLTDINDAQAILSSDKNKIWHEVTLYNIPVDGYDTVELYEISEFEYNQLKKMHLMTYESVYDSVIMDLIKDGVI